MNDNALLRASAAEEALSADDAVFLRSVGERVRAARARKGLSRKALSDRSAVSQRYLAQLENGQGNVSIALLRRIARALDRRAETLIAEEQPEDAEAARFAALFRTAADEQRRRVLDILDPRPSGTERARRIALIGLRGAGKSTLGRLSAARLGVPFIELNGEIEQASGIPVNELMALYGQEGYRRLEREGIERLAKAHEVLMLAVAGGIVSEPETFEFLLNHYHTVWLKAAPEEHMARVRGQGDTRPMAGNPVAMDELKSILTSRESLYARSDAEVDTSGKSVEESVADLVGVIERKGYLTG